MRSAILAATMILSACSAEPAADPPASDRFPAGVFAGAGRDRLCVSGEGANRRAGVIVYAENADNNCSASGALAGGALIPAGEGDCRIPLTFSGDQVTIGAVPQACAYYCGPGASLQGKSLRRTAGAKATDLGGDELC